MAQAFTVGQGYTVEDETAYFLGAADGVNLFKLEVARRLHFFYFAPAGTTQVAEIDGDLVEAYADDQLPEGLKPVAGARVAVAGPVFLKWLFTTTPDFANTAFCVPDQLEILCARRGEVTGAAPDLKLGARYIGVAPDYCVVQGDRLWRQTGLREKYPDLVLQLTPFPRAPFEKEGVFNDGTPVFVTVKSAESYGGNHAGFAEWQKQAQGEFAAFFAGAQLATWRRRFVLTPAGEAYFAKLGIAPQALRLLLTAR